MVEAVTPPNPADPSNTRQTVPDPTLLTIDALRREIAMLENLTSARVEGVEDLFGERFNRVDALMDRAEELRREQKADTKAAVDAALESQKEATHKMERSISDQISSLRSNFETSISGIYASLGDLKDRLTILESVKVGQVEQRTEQRQVTAGQLALIGSVIGIVVFVLTIIAFFGLPGPAT